MARLAMNLGATATRMMDGATKVRTKIENGALFIRPTNRVEGKNLPKGEKLIALSKRNPQRAFSTVKFSARGAESLNFQAGEYLMLTSAGRGWFELVRGVDGAAAGDIRVARS